VERLDVIGDKTLRYLIYFHGHQATLLAVGVIATWFYARRKGATAQLRRALTAVAALIAVQGAAGLAQYHLALPAEIVWVHASLAAVLWVALLWAALAAGKPALSSGAAT
jgi:heme A synthase